MTSSIPNFEQATCAGARLPLQRARRKVPVYLARGLKPLHLQNANTETCVDMNVGWGGALLIAAGQSIRDMNAAIWQATVLMALDTDDFDRSAAARTLALAMLRNGWRRKATEEVRAAAVNNAQVDVEAGNVIPYSPS